MLLRPLHLALACTLTVTGAYRSVAQATQVPAEAGDAVEARVKQLLSQMSFEEKLSLIHGAPEPAGEYQGQAGYLRGVPRLGIPGLRFADGPPGLLTRHPSIAETATMGVAATFSVKDAEDNGVVIGREARALGIDVALQPFVNIDRDLTFDRGYNTFGEDALLTSEIGAAEIRGMQAQHVMAQVKHYVGYDSNSGDILIADQPLHEIYVAPFAAATRAGVASAMCSYNRINGPFACGNKDTLTTILRDQVGFKGFMTSDWGAVHAVDFINAGLDLEMPGEPADGAAFQLPSFFDLKPMKATATPPPAPPPTGPSGKAAKAAPVDDAMEGMFGGHIPEEPPKPAGSPGDFGKVLAPMKMAEAVKTGVISQATLDRAAGNVLRQIIRFGYMDGQQKHDFSGQQTEANARIVEKTGEDAAVLLKNEGAALPLRDIASTAFIGPTAAQVDAIGISGERSEGLPEREIGPVQAIETIARSGKLQLALADNMAGEPVPAALLTHNGQPGLERTQNGSSQTDAGIDFTKKRGNALPPNTRATWKGTLTVPSAGEYWICLQALGTNAALTIDSHRIHTGAFQGGVHGDILQANQDNVVPTPDGLDNVRRALQLPAGPHEIELALTPDTSGAPVQVRLNWYTPQQRQTDHDAAIAAAKSAKTAVVFAWSRLQPVFGLPGDQDKLIEEVAAANPNVIVVLNTSQPVALPWLDKVKAVLQMWWPGDEGGWATANVLLGKTSPAGRLPVTWASRLDQYPATDPRFPERSGKGVDGKTTYTEGINVGYRWFDKEHITPLFPFGYGLSYTTFAYSGLSAAKSADGGADLSFTVRNTGPVASDEVPQVYVNAPDPEPAGAAFSVRKLVAFDRIHLDAGQSKQVVLHVPLRQLQYWSTAQQSWQTPGGARHFQVGSSSRDLPLAIALEP